MKNIFNISPLYPFLDVLVQFVIDSAHKQNINIANDIILLPTRRACRALKDVFAKLSAGNSLLPKILPLGDIDEDGFAFLDYQNDNLDLMDLPPAIPDIERNLILSSLIKKKSPSLNDEQAFSLAVDLAHLMDVVEMEMLDFKNLQYIVPENLSLYWQENLEFLQIITDWYPQILKERGYLNPVDRKIKLIYKQVEVWQKYPIKGRIFACGSTASLVPISYMITSISNMENGYVVLPHLDKILSDEDFYNVGQNHPQYGMKNLLIKMKVKREEVIDLKPLNPIKNIADKDREILSSFIMLNSSLSQTWQNMPKLNNDVLNGVEKLSLNNDADETLAIAFTIRKMIEENKKTLLITPNRNIAKAVASELKRWNIDVDDSAGTGASEIPTGNYFILLINAIVDNFAPIPLLSILKHSLSHFNMDKVYLDSLVDNFEQFILRENFLLTDIDLIISKCEEFSFINNKFDINPILNILYYIKKSLSSFLNLFNEDGKAFLFDMLTEHIKLVENFVQNNQKEPDFYLNALYKGDLNSQFSEGLRNLLDSLYKLKGDDISKMTLKSYRDFIANYLFNLKLRPVIQSHPLIAIMNSIEARLLNADVFILAGLNENTFPSVSADDPWMSRPMKAEFKLPLPERKIGLSSHDFVEFFCKKNVILTRSQKSDGLNTIESRWLQKLDAIIKISNINFSSNNDILNWIQVFTKPLCDVQKCKRPMPCPPLYARPKELWATSIEKLYRDPYIIFARYILNLKKLKDINADTLPADFGDIVHACLEEFKNKNLSSIDELKQIFIRKSLAFHNIDIIDFWFKQFDDIAKNFIDYENNIKDSVKQSFTELEGSLKITDFFTLKAKADRIDILNDNNAVVMDYKTGYAPSDKEVLSGYAPQLPLEALILNNNGFNIKNAKTSSMLYLKLSSKDGKYITNIDKNIDEILDNTYKSLIEIVSKFYDENTPYISRPNPNKLGDMIKKYSDYNHLARVKEWEEE